MNKPTVVIVGSSGTVGLDLAQRLHAIDSITVQTLSRDTSAQERQEILRHADLAVLCLPEAAAIEFTKEAEQYPHLRMLDASPAHRTNPDWVYGLPELDDNHAGAIARAAKVANPGCYATGAVLLLRPLMQALAKRGIAEQPDIAITAIGGVTSGGKKMIAQASQEPFGYRLFGLNQTHRHIPEIKQFANLSEEPIFMPAVVAHQRGTMVQIALTTRQLGLSVDEVVTALKDAYASTSSVQVHAGEGDVRFLDGADLALQDGARVDVLADGAKRRLVLVVRFDNLGKGAAGAAEQNVRLMLGLPHHEQALETIA